MATENLELNISVTGAGAGSAQIDRLTKSAQSSLNVMRLMRNVLVAASFLRASEGIFTLINSFQLMQQQLLIVTGNVQDAGSAFQTVFQIAQQSRAPLDAVNTLFQRMIRTGGTMGLTYKQVADVTRAVAQSFTIAGASADETHNAIVQLTQGLNLGILRGQDLRSVVEFNPVLAQAFADKLYSLGLTTDKYGKKIQLAGGQVYSFVTAHKNILTSKIAIDAILESAQKYDEQIRNTTPTIGQLGVNFKNSFTMIIGTLLSASGLLDNFGSMIRGLNNNLGAIIGVATAVGAAFVGWLILDLITMQFAKLFALKGIFGFFLAPILNIGRGFLALYDIMRTVVVGAAAVATGLYRAVIGVGQFIGSFVMGALNGVIWWFTTLNRLLGMFATGVVAAAQFAVRFANTAWAVAQAVGQTAVALAAAIPRLAVFATEMVIGNITGVASAIRSVAMGVAAFAMTLAQMGVSLFARFFEEATRAAAGAANAVGTALAVIGQNAVQVETTLVSVGGTAVKSLASLIGSALASMGAAMISALMAVPAILLTIMALLPVLLMFVSLITVAFGGLLSVGAGLMGLGETINGVANATLSWHDILNTFIKFALVGFDVLANHLPLVFAVIGEQWNNMVAVLMNGMLSMYQGIDTYLMQPLIGFMRLLSDAIRVLSTGLGAAAGAAVGGPIGAFVGGVAGFAGSSQWDMSEAIDSAENGWRSVGERAVALASEAGAKSGHAYTDKLTALIHEDMEKYGRGDFIKALNMIGQGVDMKTIAAQTGVEIGDLSKIQPLMSFLGKTTPQRGKLGDFGKEGTDKSAQRAVELGGFVKQVSPYQAALEKTLQFQNLLKKAEKDGLEVDGKKLTIDEYLARSGLDRAEVYRRLAREAAGVGNAETDLSDRTKLLAETVAKGTISWAEYEDQMRKARLTFLETRTDMQSGITRAKLTGEQTVGNKQAIANDVVSQAMADTITLQKYTTQVEALKAAVDQGIISNDDYADTLRKIQIAALGTQQDAMSGFQRGLLESQQSLNDFASTASTTVKTAFTDLGDTLTEFFSSGRFNIRKFVDDILNNLTRLTVQKFIMAPLAESMGIGEGGTFGSDSVLGKLFGGTGLGGAVAGATGAKLGTAANPMYVIPADINGSPLSSLLRGTMDTGPSTLSDGLRGSLDTGGASALSDILGGTPAPSNPAAMTGSRASASGSYGGIADLFSKGNLMGSGGFFSNLFSGGGGAGSTSDSILSMFGSGSAASAGSAMGDMASSSGDYATSLAEMMSSFSGYATGGEFSVGGSGGTDSQLVAFRASPDERVRIETPNQQRENSRKPTPQRPLAVQVHVHGATEPDTFVRSTGQIASTMNGALRRMASRNGTN